MNKKQLLAICLVKMRSFSLRMVSVKLIAFYRKFDLNCQSKFNVCLMVEPFSMAGRFDELQTACGRFHPVC